MAQKTARPKKNLSRKSTMPNSDESLLHRRFLYHNLVNNVISLTSLAPSGGAPPRLQPQVGPGTALKRSSSPSFLKEGDRGGSSPCRLEEGPRSDLEAGAKGRGRNGSRVSPRRAPLPLLNKRLTIFKNCSYL